MVWYEQRSAPKSYLLYNILYYKIHFKSYWLELNYLGPKIMSLNSVYSSGHSRYTRTVSGLVTHHSGLKIEHQRHKDVSYFQKIQQNKNLPSHSLQDILFLQSKAIENLFNNPICLVQRLKPINMIQGFKKCTFCIITAWYWHFHEWLVLVGGKSSLVFYRNMCGINIVKTQLQIILRYKRILENTQAHV